jgi:hypothetical protein
VLEQSHVDEWVAARTLALMHFAVTDVGIATFDAKYHYRFWRPITAIRRAHEDGNPLTRRDGEWLPLLWTPLGDPDPTFFIPPIPDYPSAGASVSAAAAEVLAAALGDAHVVDVTSPFLPGVTRHFTSLTQAAAENGMSRMYGGIHFEHAVKDGAALGLSVGREVSRLLPPVRP